MCRTTADDRALVRCGRRPDGNWYVGRGAGRGAWVCPTCAPSLTSRLLVRALRTEVSAEEASSVRVLLERATDVKQ